MISLRELSHKTILVIASFSLVVGLLGFAFYATNLYGNGLTAAALMQTAIARVNITTRASINFTVSNVDWGTGFVVDTASYCMLNTEGENNPLNCSNFTTVVQGLRLENDGNRNVDLNLSSNASAGQYIGGTGPLFQWKYENNESDSCASKGIGSNCVTNASALNFQSYTDVSTSTTQVCPCFRASNPSDLLNIELQIRIPSDSFTGLREVTLTAVATAI